MNRKLFSGLENKLKMFFGSKIIPKKLKIKKTNINRKKKQKKEKKLKNDVFCIFLFLSNLIKKRKKKPTRIENKNEKKKQSKKKTQERKQTEHKTKKERTPSFFCNNFWVLQFCLYN
jgi:hypothetical protein